MTSDKPELDVTGVMPTIVLLVTDELHSGSISSDACLSKSAACLNRRWEVSYIATVNDEPGAGSRALYHELAYLLKEDFERVGTNDVTW